MDDGRILVADDEETFLLATSDLFRREGFLCDSVADAADALRTLRDGDYDLLVADIRMPGNRGLELVKELREVAPGVPIILVTGYPSVESAVESIELPVVAYMIKPVDFDELLVRARAAIDYHRTHKALSEARQRAHMMLENLEEAAKAADVTAGRGSGALLDAFISHTLQSVTEGLLDLQQVTAALAGDKRAGDACRLLACPRRQTLRQALRDAIDALHETKTTFRSKALERLRKQLEVVLEDDGNRAESRH